ncbi:unnamed protein product [Arabidopsis halleri]
MEGDFKGVSTTATDSFNLPILTSFLSFQCNFYVPNLFLPIILLLNRLCHCQKFS